MNDNFNLGVDIFLHILILFTFLTIFFFAYISNLEKQNLDKVTDDLINGNVDKTLDFVNDWQNNINDNILPKNSLDIGWKDLDNVADDLVKNYDKENIEIKNNNDSLYRGSIITISVLFIIFIIVVIMLKFVYKYDIDLKHIVIMNFIVFLLVGIVEFIFFNYVASQYIPVTPDEITNTLVDNIKNKVF
jgi:hypothetical protein